MSKKSKTMKSKNRNSKKVTAEVGRNELWNSQGTNKGPKTATRIKKILVEKIKVHEGRRSIKESNVLLIAESMQKIGMQTPITVRSAKDEIFLVAGLHRLEAAKLLGWKKIKAVFLSGNKTEATLWEDSENLHRAELTVLERAVGIDRWRRKIRKKAKAAQAAQPGGRQPKDRGISRTAKKLGFSRDEVRRAKVIAGIAPEVRLKIGKRGLDDDQTALIAIAKESTPGAQRKKLKELLKRKTAPRRKRASSLAARNQVADESVAYQGEIDRLTQKNQTLKSKVAAKRKQLRKLKKTLAQNGGSDTPIGAATTPTLLEPIQDGAMVDVSSPPMVPVLTNASDDLGVLPILQHRALSEAEQREFEALECAWGKASPLVRERFREQRFASNQ